jgi:hypothetical protein
MGKWVLDWAVEKSGLVVNTVKDFSFDWWWYVKWGNFEIDQTTVRQACFRIDRYKGNMFKRRGFFVTRNLQVFMYSDSRCTKIFKAVIETLLRTITETSLLLVLVSFFRVQKYREPSGEYTVFIPPWLILPRHFPEWKAKEHLINWRAKECLT